VLDGWWWEAYRPGLGWAVGRSRTDDDPEAQDAFDANSIYDLLENEVSHAFYDRDSDGIPRKWVSRMKASISALAPTFNTSRMVAEYANRAYAPAVSSWHALTTGELSLAKDLADKLETLGRCWGTVKICDLSEVVDAASRLATITVQIHPGEVDPSLLRVDAIYGGIDPAGEMASQGETPLSFVSQASDGVCMFRGEMPVRGGGRLGYAIRVLPNHRGLRDPFAPGLAHWA
jgi:starch phosphorylase